MLFFRSKTTDLKNKIGPDWPAIMKKYNKRTKVPLLKNFYGSWGVDGNTAIENVEFVALDLETTGLDPTKCDIISIGLVPFNLSRIYCHQAKHWIVKPRKPIEDDSIVIHGITHSDISGAPDFRKVLDELLLSLKGKVVVVHYRRIEREFIDLAIKSRLGEGVIFPVIDTLEIESWFYRRKRHKMWSKFSGHPLTSIRLADSRKRYNLPFYHGHNALIDAIATAELLQAQIACRFDLRCPINVFWR